MAKYGGLSSPFDVRNTSPVPRGSRVTSPATNQRPRFKADCVLLEFDPCLKWRFLFFLVVVAAPAAALPRAFPQHRELSQGHGTGHAGLRYSEPAGTRVPGVALPRRAVRHDVPVLLHEGPSSIQSHSITFLPPNSIMESMLMVLVCERRRTVRASTPRCAGSPASCPIRRSRTSPPTGTTATPSATWSSRSAVPCPVSKT